MTQPHHQKFPASPPEVRAVKVQDQKDQEVQVRTQAAQEVQVQAVQAALVQAVLIVLILQIIQKSLKALQAVSQVQQEDPGPLPRFKASAGAGGKSTRGRVIGGEGKGQELPKGIKGALMIEEERIIEGTMIGTTPEERIGEGIKSNYYLF